MIDDFDERPWFVFALPGGTTTYVPASSEEEARAALGRDCYRGAPVHIWPLLCTRYTSRETLRAQFLKRAAASGQRGS
jgi:hypothetical protein